MSFLDQYGPETIPDAVVAVLSGDRPLLLDLIMLDGNPDVTDGSGRTLLHHAAETGNLDIARLLLELGADPNLRDKTGCIALHWALLEGHDAVADLLVDAGSDLDVADSGGYSPGTLMDADLLAAELSLLFRTDRQ